MYNGSSIVLRTLWQDIVFTAKGYIATVEAELGIKAKHREIVTDKEQYVLKETKITYSSNFLTY